eukprot:334537-Pelagomonas_calceolata.AAC.2
MLLSCCMSAALNARHRMQPLHINVAIQVNLDNCFGVRGSGIMNPKEEVDDCIDALQEFWCSTHMTLEPSRPSNVRLRLMSG